MKYKIKFWKENLGIPYLQRLMNQNFIVLFVFMIFIGFIRNVLEVIGNRPGFVTGYYLSVPSLYNTISYVFLMVIAEGYLLNLLFGGGKKHLRLLIQRGVWLLLGLFILIPLLNIFFNYYFFGWPFIFDIRFIHPSLYFHYGPFGIHVAFFLILFVFPFWLKRFYNHSLFKSFLITWIFYVIHFIYTYQITMSFCWGALKKYNIFNIYLTSSLIGGPAVGPMVNVYTASFVLITLIVYPFFMLKYPKTKKEFRHVSLVYILLWIHFISLFFINLPWQIG